MVVIVIAGKKEEKKRRGFLWVVREQLFHCQGGAKKKKCEIFLRRLRARKNDSWRNILGKEFF